MKLRSSVCVFVLWAGCGTCCVAQDLAAESHPPAPPFTASPGTATRPSGEFLRLAREANDQLYSDLESFVCNERVVRYRGPLSGQSAREIDTLTARVSFENGVEHYSGIHQNREQRLHIAGMEGAWSEGEYGTLLRQTELLLATQAVGFRRYETLDDQPTAVYSFEVEERDSPWDLDVGGRHYRVPFVTQVWLAKDSGQIVKIERISSDMAPDTRISEVRWSVTLHAVNMNGRAWLLPSSGEYSVSYQESGRREWNLLSFSDYQRYGSEVAVRFDRVQ